MEKQEFTGANALDRRRRPSLEGSTPLRRGKAGRQINNGLQEDAPPTRAGAQSRFASAMFSV
jgi:hypothetical protein